MGTTKYSEQSHVPNHDSKEKEFKLKENSKIQSQDLLLLNRFLNRLRVRAGFAAYRRVRLGISLPAHYDRNGLRLRRDTRERYRSPTSLRMFRAGGLLGMIALLLRLSSILHVIFLGRAFLPTVSISSRMMRAARVLSVEADTAYALTHFNPAHVHYRSLGWPWLLALCPTACPHGTGALMALVASMVVSCIRAPHPTCRTFIFQPGAHALRGVWEGC